MRLIALAVLTILWATAWPCRAQGEADHRVDEFIEAEMRRQRIPGLALGVFKEGRVVLAKAYGLANVEHEVPVKLETVFQSGSMGKQFTAALVTLLADEGRLSLDDPLSRFFPGAPQAWQRITARHLLNHTSGLGDYPTDFAMRQDHDEAQLLAMVQAAPLAFAPGERWSYSNLGYLTLGLLVRRITGRFYGDELRERVFAPLGMDRARVIDEAAIVKDRAAGYRLVRGALANQEWVAPSINTTADGSLYLSVADMARWDRALDAASLLKATSVEQMWAPATAPDGQVFRYGFGWHVERLHGRRVVFHGGAWQGFQSFIVRFPDDRFGFVVFANLRSAHALRLVRGLVAMFFPAFALPDNAPIDDPDPAVTRLVKSTLLKLAEGSADPQQFTAEAHARLWPAQARRIGEQLGMLSLPVAIIHFAELVGRSEGADLVVYRYLLTDLGRQLLCTVAVTADRRIASLSLSTQGTP